MTDFSALLQPDRGQPAHLLQLVSTESFGEWLAGRSERARTGVAAARFEGKAGEFALLPGDRPFRARRRSAGCSRSIASTATVRIPNPYPSASC